MRNYSIPRDIIGHILIYKNIKTLIYEHIQTNKEFLKNINNKKSKIKIKDKVPNYNIANNNENKFISNYKLNLNLIKSNNNNYIQNPEYSFFKTKRESFRNENILICIKKLGIEINEKEIYEEESTRNSDHNSESENDSKIYISFFIIFFKFFLINFF